jgi:hypothetical protein
MSDRDREESESRGDAAGEQPAPAAGERLLAEAVVLLLAHPAWAIWLPVGRRDWTALRPASSRPPDPDLPMVWAHDRTADELARRMRAIDEQLSPRGWFGHAAGSSGPGC